MSSRKVSVCSVATSGPDDEPTSRILSSSSQETYPHAVALRVRVLQIVCGIGSVVVGAVGCLEERGVPRAGSPLALGVPAGALAVLAASLSVYYSRGFGGWSMPGRPWGTPWRVLGPTPLKAVPLTLLWTLTLLAHVTMLALAVRVLMHLGCSTRTCLGVAGAQLVLSAAELCSAVFMAQLDLRLDSS